MPSSIPCQVSSSPQTPHSAVSPDIISKFNALKNQTKDDLSRQKSLLSSIQSNFSFLYDKIRLLEAGSNNTILWRLSSVRFIFDSAKSARRQSESIDDKTSGYWSPVFRTHPYGYNFIIRFHPYGIDATAGQFATLIFAFSLETMTVFCGGHFLKLFISASGISLIHLMRGRKRFHLQMNRPSDDQHLLSRMTHSLLPSTNTSHILNVSAKLTDTL